MMDHVENYFFGKFGINAKQAPISSAQRRSFKTHLETLVEHPIPQGVPLEAATKLNDSPFLGFALHKRKESYRYSDKQRAFIKSLFDEGQSSNRKFKPHAAVEMMKVARDHQGRLKFNPDEWLKDDQVKYLFGTCTIAQKKPKSVANGTVSEEEISSAMDDYDVSLGVQEQQDIVDALTVIPSIEEQTHPIVVIEFNFNSFSYE